jgi:hypothetical protein
MISAKESGSRSSVAYRPQSGSAALAAPAIATATAAPEVVSNFTP